MMMGQQPMDAMTGGMPANGQLFNPNFGNGNPGFYGMNNRYNMGNNMGSGY